MRALLLVLALAWASLVPVSAFAQAGGADAPLLFASAAEEHRFQALVAELRCVMCQNQSLANSNAMIARDLRREVLALMRQGKSDAQIKAFLVQRYGEFVLYRPQVHGSTWLLWFGPVALLLIGGVVVARIVRRRAAGAMPQGAAEEDQEW
jgi:cytochrome c-type biogenesis protein CcmH